MTAMPFTFAEISPPEAHPSPCTSFTCKAETKGSRRKALNLKTAPTREASDDLA